MDSGVPEGEASSTPVARDWRRRSTRSATTATAITVAAKPTDPSGEETPRTDEAGRSHAVIVTTTVNGTVRLARTHSASWGEAEKLPAAAYVCVAEGLVAPVPSPRRPGLGP